MTGWLLILSLLVLGGILSTLGDRLGSRLGKARLSIFNLRPRRTAVLITVLTGSFISALSLGLMLLVSRQLRVGLFELSELQYKIKAADQELIQRKNNIIAFRKGNIVLRSGQKLSTTTIKLGSANQAGNVIDKLLQDANLEAYRRVRPGERPNRQILLVPREDINKLKKIISQKGTWVVNIRSAGNVLLGEGSVYAFPEVRPNITLIRKGEVLATTSIKATENNPDLIKQKIRLLLASTFAEIQRRGSLSTAVEFDANKVNDLIRLISLEKSTVITLQSISLGNSDTADNVAIEIKLRPLNSKDLSQI